MILKMVFFLLALLPLAPVQAGWFDNLTSYFRKPSLSLPPKIKVLVAHDKPGVVLEVKGKYKIVDPHSGDHISTRFVGKRKFIQAVRDGLKWGEEFPGVYQLLIIPDEKATVIVDGIEYQGQIFVYDIGGTISIINNVFVEDYLSSILAQKSRDAASSEALAAVAIAARTSAYYWVENPRSPYWSVDGRQEGYQGYAAINRGTPIEHAIHETRYMIMSQPGEKDQKIRPFIAEWNPSRQNAEVSLITLEEAEMMARQGDHAAKILGQAFPGMKIELIHYQAARR